jgi:hypothetical protein
VTGQTQFNATGSATFYITGVQLEKGSTATSFDYRPYGTEILLCQRYFQAIQNSALGGNPYSPVGIGVLYNTTTGTFILGLPTAMRIQPSLTTSGTIFAQNQGINVSSFSGPNGPGTSTNGGFGNVLDCDFVLASAATAGTAAMLKFNNQSTRLFTLSAEL